MSETHSTTDRRRQVVDLPLGDRSYRIHVGAGALGDLPRLWREEVVGADVVGADSGPATARAVLITDGNVGALYGDRVESSLADAGARPLRLETPVGERAKSFAELERLCDAMARAGIDRGAVVVALGGGVVGDLAGFVAASYMRGLRYAQAPTSLLAMVDSSVGGKVAVNLPAGKNLAGAFHQPRLVVADLDALATLPRREWLCGAAEIVKYGAIMDPEFFDRLETIDGGPAAADPPTLAEIVAHCCRLKARVVAGDERERGHRAILNFGHTVGHALENLVGYGELVHGEAVSIGMRCEAELGVRLGWTPRPDADRLGRLLSGWGLPTVVPARIAPAAVIDRMRRDKKASDGRIRLSLIRELGRCEVSDEPPPGLLEEVLDVCGQ